MKKVQKGFVGVLLIILLAVLIVIAGGAYIYSIQKNQFTAPPTVQFGVLPSIPTVQTNPNSQVPSQQNTGSSTDASAVWNDNEVSFDNNGSQIQAYVNKPQGKEFNLVLMFTGTTDFAQNNSQAALALSNQLGKRIVASSSNFMTASVVYDANAILRGGVIPMDVAEAALLWFKNNASNQLGIKIDKIYLLGHSQGGYIVTKLDSLYKTDGVIANGPGPINLTIRCLQEGKMKPTATSTSDVCGVMQKLYGDASTNPTPYDQRSLIYGLGDMKSPLLVLQGGADQPGQLALIPKLMAKLQNCQSQDCASSRLVEIPGVGHYTFNDPRSWSALMDFLNNTPSK